MIPIRWSLPTDMPDWHECPEFRLALSLLAEGKLVAVPTETVYGLAADAANGLACARIFEAKGRPKINPLISHVAGYGDARLHGRFNRDGDKLARRFWPGPLTLVVPKIETSPIADLATAGLQTVALRVPAAPLTQALSSGLKRPLAAPSANVSGRISPTTGQDVIEELGDRVDMVIDAGRTEFGIESTIVACVGDAPALLRPGGIPTADIDKILDKPLKRYGINDGDRPAAPGMLASHYAPNAQIRLNSAEVGPNECLLAFGPKLPEGANGCRQIFNLSVAEDLHEAASRLFEGLRQLDSVAPEKIAAMPIPNRGIGEAINDRLNRATAPRA